MARLEELDMQGRRYVTLFEGYVKLAIDDYIVALKFFDRMHPKVWKEHPQVYNFIIKTCGKKKRV